MLPKQCLSSGKPLRVLHILGSAQRGGTESVVYNWYRAVDRDKLRFDIVIDECSPCGVPAGIQAMGCKIYSIPPYSKLIPYSMAIKDICKKGNYKIVHSHMNALSVFPLFAACLAKVPVRIAHSHSTLSHGEDGKRDLIKKLLRPFSGLFATHYFACSAHAGRWLFGGRAFGAGKVVLAKNAIDTQKFRYEPEARAAARKRLGLEDKLVLGHVGRFSPQKNHGYLLDVFRAVCEKRGDAALLLIGGMGSAGEGIEDAVREKAKAYGIADKVCFLGSSEDISGYYQAMDVFVLPSLYEGLGMAAVEAQCAGLPCVLSNRVPKEAKLVEDVTFLPLDTSEDAVKGWAAAILAFAAKKERRDGSALVAAAGYEIAVAAKDVEAFYLAEGEAAG